jgi:hypothetical protein
MSKAAHFRELFRPWAGLVVGLVATGFVHQFGSDSVFDHCAAASPGPVLVVALTGIAVTVAAALWSWRVVGKSEGVRSRELVAIVSVGSAAVFVIAMFLPMIAALVIPPCFQ